MKKIINKDLMRMLFILLIASVFITALNL